MPETGDIDQLNLLAALEHKVQRAERELARLASENRRLREEIAALYPPDALAGNSAAMRLVLETIRRVAPTHTSVLICGEPGTGKELVARAIHAASPRSELPFIKLHCATLDAETLGNILADDAPEGSLFLDEVGELKADMQALLLRALLDRETQRAVADDGSRPRQRLLAATRHDLRQAVRNGDLRDDLYYRLVAFPIELPPLRARIEDLPALVQHFMRKHAQRAGRRINGVDPDTLANLARHPWPGNLRELEHLVEHALALNTSASLKISAEMLAVHMPQERSDLAAAATGMHHLPAPDGPRPPFEDTENTGLHHVQREHILRVLKATHWVIEGGAGAALKLGMKPATLRHRMKKLGITRAASNGTG